jgi:hypothetical protein
MKHKIESVLRVGNEKIKDVDTYWFWHYQHFLTGSQNILTRGWEDCFPNYLHPGRKCSNLLVSLMLLPTSNFITLNWISFFICHILGITSFEVKI